MSLQAGIFKAALKFLRLDPTVEGRLASRVAETLPGPRGRKIFLLNDDIHVGGVHRADAVTAAGSGNIYISRSVVEGDRTTFTETLRHETVRSVLKPRNSGLRAVTGRLYAGSQVYRYVEESAAQTYATRSLRQGVAYPMERGTVTSRGVMSEIGTIALAGGAIVGWAWWKDNHS